MALVPSINLLLTNSCPNGCSYCFAPLTTDPDNAQWMREEDLCFALNFLKHSGAQNVRFLGGEPLLHPGFPRAYENALAMEGVECVSIFTSANVFPDRLKFLRTCRTNLTVNVNHPDDYTPEHHLRVWNNLERLADMGLPIIIGHNVYRPQMDFSWLFTLCESLGVERVRIALASPSQERRTSAPALVDRASLGSSLYALLATVGKSRIKVFFDCLVTPCLFSYKEWDDISRLFPEAIAECSSCGPALDVHPNLEVTRCCGVGKLASVHLRDFSCSADLLKHFEQSIDVHRRAVVSDECQNCREFQRHKCNGHCLGYSVGALEVAENARISAQAPLATARESTRRGEIELALQQFEVALSIYAHDGYAVCDYLWVLIHAGMFPRAKEVYTLYGKAIESTPREMSALLHGMLAEINDNKRLAISHYRSALRGVHDDGQRSWISSRIQSISRKEGDAKAGT